MYGLWKSLAGKFLKFSNFEKLNNKKQEKKVETIETEIKTAQMGKRQKIKIKTNA